MEGLREGEGLNFEHVPTNEQYCAPGNVYDSLKLLCVSEWVCLLIGSWGILALSLFFL